MSSRDPSTSSPDPLTPSTQNVAKPGVRLAVVAVIACLAQFMVVLDSSIVNVALPAMKAGLGLSVGAQQWVVDGYLITFGGLLLLASRASDLFGRRRVFQIGLVVFTAASLLGGLAQDGVMLLVARFVQGAGAAALGPASLSLITASHTEPGRRTRALTWWGVAAAGAGAAGIVLGGVLTASLSWRWVLLVNVPIGAGLLVATFVALQASTASERRTRIDVPGAVTVTLGVAAIVYGVSAAPQDGWASGQVLAAIVAAIVLLAAFLLIESRTREPLIPREVFAEHNVRIGNVLTGCLGLVITAPLFFLSLYLQQVLGETALRAGLSLLPMAVVISVGVLASQKLIPGVGPKRLVLGGGLIAAGGLVWLAQLPVHSAYAVHVLAPTLIVGAGMSVTMMPAIVAATTGGDPRNAGVASGLINMCRQIGGALGLAALVTVASTVTHQGHTTGPESVVHGYRTALLVAAAVSLATAVLSLLLKEPRASAPAAPARRDEATADAGRPG
ncbi:MFS transporter [Streptomyces sp. SL13]|uniref:MFS transporter n=1 Tax=Streptantibioticus silvisoli TaxID=2705255 RepID=A0AA90HAG3_9ACTN|nr:MFS transporter [Streptantibioticus silvisoli]MDI5971062.1 MFS transporter [Streptantibioticus silvisoli]